MPCHVDRDSGGKKVLVEVKYKERQTSSDHSVPISLFFAFFTLLFPTIPRPHHSIEISALSEHKLRRQHYHHHHFLPLATLPIRTPRRQTTQTLNMAEKPRILRDAAKNGEQTRSTSHGRGGAGNINSGPSTVRTADDMRTPEIKQPHYTTGRGGTGKRMIIPTPFSVPSHGCARGIIPTFRPSRDQRAQKDSKTDLTKNPKSTNPTTHHLQATSSPTTTPPTRVSPRTSKRPNTTTGPRRGPSTGAAAAKAT